MKVQFFTAVLISIYLIILCTEATLVRKCQGKQVIPVIMNIWFVNCTFSNISHAERKKENGKMPMTRGEKKTSGKNSRQLNLEKREWERRACRSNFSFFKQWNRHSRDTTIKTSESLMCVWRKISKRENLTWSFSFSFLTLWIICIQFTLFVGFFVFDSLIEDNCDETSKLSCSLKSRAASKSIAFNITRKLYDSPSQLTTAKNMLQYYNNIFLRSFKATHR